MALDTRRRWANVIQQVIATVNAHDDVQIYAR
jgi:hypothetical protein